MTGLPVQKRDAARGANELGAGNAAAEAGTREMVDSTQWDEDDVMPFFWGKSKASCYQKKVEQITQRMEEICASGYSLNIGLSSRCGIFDTCI